MRCPPRALRNTLAAASALCAALLLNACGGGSGGTNSSTAGTAGAPTAATYTVGGTLSGLAASSVVVLENNGGDALTLQGNGAFTFSQALASGSTYSVTVAAQPNGQSCSVGNGSGTVGADVTNITVTCAATSSTSQYTIGGVLSGLASAASIVLEDNGGNALTQQSNGAFTFSQPVAAGGRYSVTVATQPNGQTCNVGNGSGTAGGKVTNVTVTCSSTSAGNYTIGGTLSGLSASTEVVLGDNGGNALTLQADGAFSFSQALAAGATYSVTVVTQPNGEICSVAAGSGTASADVTSVAVTCNSFAASSNSSNAVAMTVEPGPASSGSQPFNQPLVSVTICVPNSTTCGTVNGILVDTGSYGLRIMASALSAAGVSLSPTTDPLVAGNTIQECLPFADGYAWGQVSLASVSIGGETTGSSLPIQVINDSASPSPAVPSSCQSKGTSLDSVDALGTNGVLGVGVFVPDCGSYCDQTPAASNDIYYSCSSSGSCTMTAQAIADQVSNPVFYFPTDNNGVILQLPAISSSGALTAGGYLVFGIGTRSNNVLANAAVLTVNATGNITTTFNGSTLSSSFIDSGSNALFFNDSSLALCGTSAPENAFYCPASTVSLSATNQGANGTTSPANFSIANLNDGSINANAYAINDTGGPAPSIAGFGPYFDWGIPFFYGRTIYFALNGATADGIAGPYFAY